MATTTPSHYHPCVVQLLARPQYEQRTPIWYETRRSLITASDAAAAIGVKPYDSYRGCPRAEALLKKVENKKLNNQFVRHGIKYEDECRDLFASMVGEEVLDHGLVVHASLPWLGASPDGICTRSGKLLEIKCPLKREILPGHIPHHYYPQVQTQMEVCDFDFTYFVQYKPAFMMPDNRPFIDIVVVERDREWFRQYKETLYSFWEQYMDLKETYVPPSPPHCLIVEDMYV